MVNDEAAHLLGIPADVRRPHAPEVDADRSGCAEIFDRAPVELTDHVMPVRGRVLTRQPDAGPQPRAAHRLGGDAARPHRDARAAARARPHQSTTDTLRAQAHEFSNRMHVVSGLIELGEYDERAQLRPPDHRRLQTADARTSSTRGAGPGRRGAAHRQGEPGRPSAGSTSWSTPTSDVPPARRRARGRRQHRDGQPHRQRLRRGGGQRRDPTVRGGAGRTPGSAVHRDGARQRPGRRLDDRRDGLRPRLQHQGDGHRAGARHRPGARPRDLPQPRRRHRRAATTRVRSSWRRCRCCDGRGVS